jgi:hypothetical protein
MQKYIYIYVNMYIKIKILDNITLFYTFFSDDEIDDNLLERNEEA